jgi:polyisoprenoid-binding protein YceI
MRKWFLLLCLWSAALFAGEWQVDKSANNRVVFTSEVVVLTFDGVTDQIDGFLYWEGDSLFPKNNQFHFEVDLNSIETGIGKRDRDMRDVLETNKWPLTYFEGTIATHRKTIEQPPTYEVVAKGQYFVHGVTKNREIPATVTLLDDGRMHVTAQFTVLLSDHQIEAPNLIAFVKVSDEIKVQVNFYLKAVADDSN